VVRGLALTVDTPAHIGRIVAGGRMQYFGTWFSSDSGFVTAPLCDEVRLVGLCDHDRATVLHRIARWEEASAWLAEQMEQSLARAVIVAMAEPGNERTSGGNDWRGVVRDAPVCSSTLEAACPDWWVNACESMFLPSQLQRRGYLFERVLKSSWKSLVVLARHGSSSVGVVIKLS
jgi:hypothetical protein